MISITSRVVVIASVGAAVLSLAFLSHAGGVTADGPVGPTPVSQKSRVGGGLTDTHVEHVRSGLDVPAEGASTLAARRPADRAAYSLEEATRIANELAARREDPLRYAMRAAREAAEQVAEKERAWGVADGEATSGSDGGGLQQAYAKYVEALRALGQFQDAARLEVLAPALASTSRDVRSAALEALRDGTVSDDEVLAQVRSMATGDPDPYVQRDALEVYVRYGDQSDVLSLVQSLGRASGPTRDIAVREWLRIEEELAAAPFADEQPTRSRR